MSDPFPVVYLARHGETAWTISGQHTGVTDLPLTAQGEAEAVRLGERLKGLRLATVLTSPLQRAVRTCELAGFGSMAGVEPDLLEWDYGAYEGLQPEPACGEHSEKVSARKEQHVPSDGSRPAHYPVGPALRSDPATPHPGSRRGTGSNRRARRGCRRWCGPGAGRYFFFGTASLSAVGYEHDRSDPVIRLWDEMPREGRGRPGRVRGDREEARR